MNLELEIGLLTLLSTGTLLGGIFLILFYGATLTILGILLIILSVIVFLVDMTDIIGHWRWITGE